MYCKTEDGRLQLLLLSLKCVFGCRWRRILNMCGHRRSKKGRLLVGIPRDKNMVVLREKAGA